MNAWNWKAIGRKLGLIGAYLSGLMGSGAGLTEGMSDQTLHQVLKYCVYAGLFATVLGHIIELAADDSPVPPFPTAGKVGLLCVALLCAGGCTSATPTYHAGVATEGKAYEMAYANLSNQYDAQQTALINVYTQKKDIELTVDLNSLQNQAILNPAKWNATAIAAETTRLQALHDSKIAEYAASLQNFHKLKDTNETVNLGTARKLSAALNPPALPTATVDLSGQINAASGASAPAPINATK